MPGHGIRPYFVGLSEASTLIMSIEYIGDNLTFKTKPKYSSIWI